MDDALPKRHILVDARQYVALELFEAANEHVLGQGQYHNQLIAVLNDQGRIIARLTNDKKRLTEEVQDLQAELAECHRVQAAMRQAVHGAAEGL